MQDVYVPRPCDRCGAGMIDSEYVPEGKAVHHPMCSEFHMAHGVVAWLCFDCRRMWHQEIDGHDLAKEYEEASFRLEFWKTRVDEKTTDEQIEKGLELYKRCSELERRINMYANEWLTVG